MKRLAFAMFLASTPGCTIANPRLGDLDQSTDTAMGSTDGSPPEMPGDTDEPAAPDGPTDAGLLPAPPEIEMLSVDGMGEVAVIERVRPVALSVVAVDDAAVVRAHLRVDGEPVATLESPPWSATWTPADAGDNGTRTFEVELEGYQGASDVAEVAFLVEVPDPGTVDWELLETVAPFPELGYEAVTLPGDGTIVVAGEPGVLRKLDGTGAPLWTRTFTGPEDRAWIALASDPDGTLAGTASFDGKMWVETFDPAGSSIWSTYYEGGTTPGRAEGVALDGPRLVYVGWHGDSGARSWIARAHDGTAQVWTLGAGPTYVAEAGDVAYMPDGRLVIAGSMGEDPAGLGGFVQAVHPDGELDWEWVPGSSALGRSVAVDPEGHVLVALQDLGASSIHRLTPAGQELWTRAWSDVADDPFALVWSLAAHTNGDVTAVAGTGETVHLDAQGIRAWSRTLDGQLADVAVDDLGYAVVVGRNVSGLGRGHVARLHP